MKIIVVGAGFGGLTTAALLAKKGHEVTLIEKNEQAGGRASVLKKDGFTFDMGPSWYLMPDIFERIFKELGTTPKKELELQQLDPSYSIYFGKEKIDIRKDIKKNLKLFEEIEPGASDKLKTYLETAKKQYDIAINKFIFREYNSIKDVLQWELAKEGSKLSVFGNLDKYVSKYFENDKLKKILEYSMVFLGGAPKNTPALYSIMSHVDLNQGVFYPKGGMNAVAVALERIGKKLGVKYIYNEPVTKLISERGKITQVKTTKKTYSADKIIVNADYQHAETKLLDVKDQTYDDKYWEKRTIAPSAFIMYLGVNKKLKGLTHHTLVLEHDWMKHFNEIFSDPKWPKQPSYYVCCPSKTEPETAPKGMENIFVLVPVASGLKDTPSVRRKYEEQILTHLEETIGENIRDHIVAKEIFAHKDFTNRYNAYKGTALGLTHTLTQTAIFRPKLKSKNVDNLYYVGHYTHPGIGVPMVMIAAQLVTNMITDGR